MSNVHSILKSMRMVFLLATGVVLSFTSFAQSEAEQGNATEDNDGGTSTHTVKITRKVSSVSKGYRIQIYSGADREAAKATKISFMKRFPSVRSYISYEVPYYKIKVGDFKTRKEATEFHRYLGKTYSTTIVPSLINNRIPQKVKPPVVPKPQEESSESGTATAAEPAK